MVTYFEDGTGVDDEVAELVSEHAEAPSCRLLK